MTRDEALVAMRNGEKITHTYFTDDEFIYMKGHDIWSEDGYNFGSIFGEFWQTKVNNLCFDDDWSIYKEN
jgi:hypothetical protein